MTFEEYTNLTDIQKEYAHMFIRTTIEFNSVAAFNSFLENPAEAYFKMVMWDSGLFLRNYKNKPRTDDKYTEKVLDDTLLVYDLLDDTDPSYAYREANRKRFIENFLLQYTEYTDPSSILMDEELNKKLIECFKSDSHASWEFPRTKIYKETTIKRMKLSIETYLENCEFLKPYYNSLKNKNPELKDTSIKLVNEVSGGATTTKPTLYNTTRSISKDIYKYPIKDLSRHFWNVCWSRAVENEKTAKYIVEELSKPFNPEIDYNRFFSNVGYHLIAIKKSYEIFKNQFESKVYTAANNNYSVSVRDVVSLFKTAREYNELEAKVNAEDIADIILKYYGKISRENLVRIIELLNEVSRHTTSWNDRDMPNWCFDASDNFRSFRPKDVEYMLADIKGYEDRGEPIPVFRDLKR